MRDYTELTYADKPFTSYPNELTRYLCKRYAIKQGSKILDIGCGRGEYVNGFVLQGMYAEGVDNSEYARKIYPWMIVHKKVEYDLQRYDVIFSKSLLEHISNPEIIMEDMFYALNPDGLCIAMVPDYDCCWRGFYGDIGHVRPLTQGSLAELFKWVGFNDVYCEKFLQSPPLWDAPWKTGFYKLAAHIPFIKKSNNVIFSQKKYTMLLCSGRKI